MPNFFIKINTIDITPYLKLPDGYGVMPATLYSDAGRNMAGNLQAQFLGTFPKIELTFRPLTEAELKIVVGLLNNGSISVQWWDVKTSSHKTGTFYAGDYSPKVADVANEIYGSFSVSLISYNKLS